MSGEQVGEDDCGWSPIEVSQSQTARERLRNAAASVGVQRPNTNEMAAKHCKHRLTRSDVQYSTLVPVFL